MPPCAAMECARRGLSWKQKALTLYPSSPNVAAAAAPANPVPTTMISNLRLLAGLTSFISCRYFVHFVATGPDGVFELSLTLIIAIGTVPGAVATGFCYRYGTGSGSDRVLLSV